MTTKNITKIQNKTLTYKYPLELKRDVEAWEGLAGIWKGRKPRSILNWQKNIRKEWERKLPKSK